MRAGDGGLTGRPMDENDGGDGLTGRPIDENDKAAFHSLAEGFFLQLLSLL